MMRRLFFAYRVHKNIRVCLVHKRTPITPNLPILCVPASTKNPFLVLKSQVMNKKICILTKAKLSNSLNFCHKIQWKMWILSSNKKLIYSIWVLEQKVDFWHSVHMVSYLKHFVGSSGHWLSFDLWKKGENVVLTSVASVEMMMMMIAERFSQNVSSPVKNSRMSISGSRSSVDADEQDTHMPKTCNPVSFTDITGKFQYTTVLENRLKSLILHYERSEIRFHFAWVDKSWLKLPKWPIWRVFENLKLAVKQCY